MLVNPFNAIMQPKARQPVAHAVENSVSISGNAAANALIGKSDGRTIKVRGRTLRGLQIAEGVIHEVKRDCLPHAGNQITDIHETNGWSYLLAQTYRQREKSEHTLRDGPNEDRVREALQLHGGTCRAYAVTSLVLTQAKAAALPAGDPLRTRPLHLVSDSSTDHNFVVWGERAKGTKGKFDKEAIVIDAWTGLAKPYLAKELGAQKTHLDSLASMEVIKNPGNSAAFNLERERAAASTPEAVRDAKKKIEKFLDAKERDGTGPRNAMEVREHLRNTEGVPTSGGPDMLDWVREEHDRKDFVDNRVTLVSDVSTRYVDKDGNYNTFDHLDSQYVQEFAQRNADAVKGPLASTLEEHKN